LALPVAVVLAATGGSDPPSASPDKRTAQIATSIEVRNGMLKTKDIPDRSPYIDSRQVVDASQPTIFVNVRNNGSLGTAIDRMRLYVEDVAKLPNCEQSGGPGDVRTWTRGIAMSEGIRRGDTLETDNRLIAAVAADNAASFALRLRPSQAQVSAAGRETYLYRLRPELRQVGDATWRSLGQVAVALPEVPVGDLDGSIPFIADCTARDRRIMRTLIARGGPSLEMSHLLRACQSGRCSYADDK